jgi:hypothetical protein
MDQIKGGLWRFDVDKRSDAEITRLFKDTSPSPGRIVGSRRKVVDA